jgi:uncharacterized protein (TIGR02996 family)
VYAIPDDDEPRRVYADALLERGDPRGELIALQLERERRRGLVSIADAERERALIATHRRAWLGPLAAVVQNEQFRRGFLDACTVTKAAPAQLAAALASPIWRTLRTLDTDDMALATHPALVSLRTSSMTPAALAELAARPAPLPLAAAIGTGVQTQRQAFDDENERWVHTRLVYGIAPGTPAEWGGALTVGALGNLRSLQLAGSGAVLAASALGWLLESPLGAQLTELDLFEPRENADPRSWGDRALVDRLATWVIALVERGTPMTIVLRSGWTIATPYTSLDFIDHFRVVMGRRGEFTIDGDRVPLTDIRDLVRSRRPSWRIRGIKLEAGRRPAFGSALRENLRGRFAIEK